LDGEHIGQGRESAVELVKGSPDIQKKLIEKIKAKIKTAPAA